MDIKKLKNSLNNYKGKIYEISAETGIHYNTIYSIKTGKNKNPSYEVFVKLKGFLENDK